MDPATIFGTATAALGAINLIATSLTRIYRQYKLYLDNPSRWLELAHEYMKAERYIQSIQTTLPGRNLSQDARSDFEDKLNSISAMMGEVRHKLEQIETVFQAKKRDRFRNATHTVRDNAVLQFAEERLERVMARIERLAIALRLEEMGEDIRLMLKDMKIRREHVSTQEFKAIAGADAVEATPEFLALDYDSKDREGNAVTIEGELKAKILQTRTNTCVGVLDAHVTDSKVTGAVGGGGVGKTCAVRGLAKDPEILKTFTGGIYEIALGKDAHRGTITDRLRILIQLTGNRTTARELDGNSDLNTHIVKACEWFRLQEKPCLFIVDDVWENNGIDGSIIRELSKIVDACDGCIVFTSRNHSFSEVADETIEFRARETKEARAMLLCKAQMNENDTLVVQNEEKIRRVLHICGGLPAALAVAGRLIHDLKRNDPWGRLLHRLERSPASLWNKNPQGYRALSKLLDTALEYLDEKRENKDCLQTTNQFFAMGRSLCVLDKQEFAPISMLSRLWDLDTEEALEVVELMANVGIVTKEYGRIEGKSLQYCEDGLRIHDLVNEYFTECASKANTSGRKPAFHKHLLNKYLSGTENLSNCGQYRTWWELKDDVYIFERLCRHLLVGELSDEAVGLLLDARWTTVSLVEYGIRNLKHDYEMTIQALQRRTTDYVGRLAEERIRALRVILRAAQLSAHAVSRNQKEVWYQLYGRLVSFKEENSTLNDYLERIEEHAKRPWMKPSPGILQAPGCAITETLPIPPLNNIRDFSINRDDTILAVLVENQGTELRLWKRRTDASEKVADLSNPFQRPSAVDIVSFSKDGNLFATGHKNGYVVLWDSRDGKKKCELPFHDENYDILRQFSWSMDGERLAALTNVCIYVWETQRGERVGLLPGRKIQCIALSPTGSRVISAIAKEYAQIVEVDNGLVLQEMKEYCWKTKSMHWLSESTILACAEVPTFMIWNAHTGQCIAEPTVNDDVFYLSSSTNERQVTGLTFEGILVFTVPHFEVIGRVQLPNINVRCQITLSPNGSKIACVMQQRRGSSLCHVLDTQLVEVPRNGLRPYCRQVQVVRFSSDGRWLACGREDGSLQVWNMANRVPEIEWNGNGDDVCVLEWSRDGSKLGVGHTDGHCRVWDWRNRRQIGGILYTGRRYSPTYHVLQFSGADDDRVVLRDVRRDQPQVEREWEYQKDSGLSRVEALTISECQHRWRSKDRLESYGYEEYLQRRLVSIADGAVQWEGDRLGSIEVRRGIERHLFDFTASEDESDVRRDVIIAIPFWSEVLFIDLIQNPGHGCSSC